jgi:hypothetical protein
MLFLPGISFKPQINQSSLNMKRANFVLMSMLLLPAILLGSEKVVISQWLSTGPLPVNYPAFHQMQNVEGKTFSNTELLSFSHFSLKDYFPEENLSLQWFGGKTVQWQGAFADENGFFVLDDGSETGEPQVAYLATYVKTERWISTQLEIRSAHMLEAYLNGERIGSKTTIEKEEGTTGRVSKELKLPRGTHLLVIKALRPAEGRTGVEADSQS